MQNVTLYILRGESGKRYVGITTDLSRRLFDHSQGKTRGGQVLGKFRLLLTESYPDYPAARTREKFLKSGQGRRWLDQVEQEMVTRNR
ncbi:MAG: GIY-YIG nuclease family protein [Proteobacteria bacterium]|nr:GIY-YIG nuclease family protein [Pseudomonadota bacterium]